MNGIHAVGFPTGLIEAAGLAERGLHRREVVGRGPPAAFRLLWRDAWHQPPFADLAEEFQTYVTVYARAILSGFLDDEVLLDWAARSAGAHLVDGICNWLDGGDPARDDEVAAAMSRGLRALAVAWADDPVPAVR